MGTIYLLTLNINSEYLYKNEQPTEVALFVFARYLYQNVFEMGKTIIRLTESDLHKIVRDSVYQILEQKQTVNEGWKNWAMAGTLGAASMFGNPQTTNAQDDMYFSSNQTTQSKVRKNQTPKTDLFRQEEQKIRNGEIYLVNTSRIRFGEVAAESSFKIGDEKCFWALTNSGNFYLFFGSKTMEFDSALVIQLDESYDTTKLINFFKAISDKAHKWDEICVKNEVGDLRKNMPLPFNGLSFMFNYEVSPFSTYSEIIIKRNDNYYRSLSPSLTIKTSHLDNLIKYLSELDLNSSVLNAKNKKQIQKDTFDSLQ